MLERICENVGKVIIFRERTLHLSFGTCYSVYIKNLCSSRIPASEIC